MKRRKLKSTNFRVVRTSVRPLYPLQRALGDRDLLVEICERLALMGQQLDEVGAIAAEARDAAQAAKDAAERNK